MAEPEARRRGRPRSSPEGRGGTLTISINPNTRAALEAAAAQLGRSLSQTAEYAIERGRLVGELGAAGPAIADELQSMLRTAVEIIETTGDPTSSLQARDELRERWADAARAALPKLSSPPKGVAVAKAAISAMRHAAIDAYGELRSAENSSLSTALEHLRKISNAELFPGMAEWNQAASQLQDAAAAEPGPVAECLDLVLHTAEAAARAVARQEAPQ